MRRWLHIALRVLGVLGLVIAMLVPGGPAAAAGTIEGAGSSFVQLEIEQWRSDISRDPYNISMNYVSSGSTFGRQQYVANLVDFAMSDIPFEPDELGQAANRPYTYVTLSAGGIGFMYNLKDGAGRRVGLPANKGGTGTDLKLRPRTVCRIFTQRMYWDDPEIVADNPDIALPHNLVTPVYRSDGAGTTFIVHEYCQATAPDIWQQYVDIVRNDPQNVANAPAGFLDGRPTSKWSDIGVAANAFAGDGVADFVASDVAGQNSITYVEAGFAEVRNFPNALVRNNAGVFQYPEAAQVTRALSYATRNSDATVTLEFLANDPDAYFPSAYSYAIVPTAGISAEDGLALGTFLNYAATLGQAKADELGYAPLSREVVEISLAEVQRIPGAPPVPEIVVYEPVNEAPQTGGGGPVVDSNAGGPSPGAGGADGGGTDGTADPTTATTVPCAPATTTTTAVAAAGGETTTTAAPAATTTVDPAAPTTTIDPAAPTTTTLPPCESTTVGGSTTSGGTRGNTSTGGPLLTGPDVDALASGSSGPTNTDVLWALAQGVAIAAAGALVAQRFVGRAST